MKCVTSPVWPARLDRLPYVTSVTSGFSRTPPGVTQKGQKDLAPVELILPNETDSPYYKLVFSQVMVTEIVFYALGKLTSCVCLYILLCGITLVCLSFNPSCVYVHESLHHSNMSIHCTLYTGAQTDLLPVQILAVQ